MTDLAKNISELSPEQREILLHRLRQLGRDTPQAAVETIPHVPRIGDTFPTSFAQERFWFLDQLVPGNPADHITRALHMAGPLDAAALRAGLQLLVDRHESLRTSFVLRDGKPLQRIAPRIEVPLAVVDLADCPADRREERVRQLAVENNERPFRLDALPLLRAVLLRLGPEEHVLLFVLHHIVADGWSLGILIAETLAFYESARRGTPLQLPELPIQYVDYALWQRRQLESGAWDADLAYWRRQLAGELPPSELPTDRPRPSDQGFRGSRAAFTLAAPQAGALARLGREGRATPFMTMLAAFVTFLHRCSGQDDLLVGSPIANRTRVEIEGLIGFFVNMIVLRTRVGAGMSFRQVLAEVRATAIDAFQHQGLPFEHLVEEIQPERDPARSPVFQVAFSFQNQPAPKGTTGGLRVGPLEIEHGSSQYDLSLSVFEESQGLLAWFEYSSDLFDETTIRRWTGSFEALVDALPGDTDGPILGLALLPDHERHQLLHEWNDTAAAGEPVCLHRRFEATVRSAPDAAAVEFGDEVVSYGEVNRRANRLARRLRQLGVGPEVLVGLAMERRPELVVGLLAILKAGGAFLPLDPADPRERLLYVLADSAAPVILTAGDEAAEIFSRADAVLLRLDREEAAADDGDLPLEPLPAQLAYAIYTSGSTGRPKGAGISQGSFAHHLAWRHRYFGMRPGDKTLQKTSIGFDTSLWEIGETLASGATLVLAQPGGQRDSSYLVDAIRRHGVTALDFVPSMLGVFLDEKDLALCTSVRRIETGGESLPLDLHRRVRETFGVYPHNGYGPTEACVNATLWSPGPDARPSAVAIGRPIDNARLYVCDAAGGPVPLGIPGELSIAGPGLGRGYLGRPDLTAAKFVPDPWNGPGGRLYRTGDLVRYQPDGTLAFVGRIDQQVKVRGYRIELREVESVVRQHPAVRDAAVLVQGEGSNVQLVAFVVASAEVSVAELRAFAGNLLPDYMVPGGWGFLDELPLTASGKLDRRALAARGGIEGQRGAGHVAPGNPVEELLCSLWARLLGRDEVGTRDNFFALGGHSLLAIQVVNSIREALAVNLPLRELFKNPTIAELSRVISQLRGKEGGGEDALPQIVPAPALRHEPFPLTEIQEAYWIGRSQNIELGGVSAHNYWEIEGENIDLARLTAALRKLIDRHDMLRGIVRPDGVQQILREVPPYEIATLDLRDQGPEAAEAALAAVREQMSHQVLPAERWPLFELRAALLPNGRTRLYLSVDGLVSDAWSWRILSREFRQFYLDPELELPPLEISFADYVRAEVAVRATPVYQKSLAYWRERVRTLAPAPELPAVKDFQSLDKLRFGRFWDELTPQQWGAIKEHGTRVGLTPSVIVLAAFSEVLATWSRNGDFTVNLTLFNRLPLHPQVDQLVGDFTSLVMLEVQGADQGTFEERARRVQERLWDDLDHSHVSGVRVLRELARTREESLRAFMPVVFSSTLNLPQTRREVDTLEGSGDEVDVIYGITQTPQTTLDHQVSEQDGHLVFIWDVLEEAYPPDLWADMFDAYRDLLHRLAEGPAAWREPRRLLTPARQLALRAEVNGGIGEVPDVLLHELFLRAREQAPDRPAVHSAEQTLTYAELHGLAGPLAHELRARGARPGQLMAVVMEKGWEQAVAVLAILEAGAAYLPVDAALPAERMHYLLADGEVEVALTQPWLDGQIEWPATVHRIAVERAARPGAAPAPLPRRQTLDDLAYVIYTSGSTGHPKGVMIDHRGAVNTILDINRRFGVTPADRVLALSALSFDLSVYDLFGALAAGAALVVAPAKNRQDPAVWADHLVRYGVTIWNSVPAVLELLVDWLERHPEVRPAGLRLVLLSGDWIPLHLPDRLRRLVPGVAVISLGGATEASIWSIFHPVGEVDPAWKSIPYGKPLDNQSFQVLDRTLRPRPVWVPGELYIGGVGLARGYWHDEAKTAASFLTAPDTGERLYRTGDLGRYLPDGTIEFLGREDLQVKVQGHRIELGEVEAALAAHPAIAAAVAAAWGERHGNKRLVGYFVRQPGAAPPSPEELLEFLQHKLPEPMIPQAFCELERIPLTANGKVDRKALPEVQATAPDVDPERLAAVRRIARRVAELAARVLHVDQVDPDARLLETGASSVDVVRIGNLLEDEFGFRPRLDDLFRMSISGAVADYYEELLGRGGIYRRRSEETGTSAWDPLLRSFPVLRDPKEREGFKHAQPGLRSEPGTGLYVELAGPAVDEDLKRRYLERRSRRFFSAEPVGREPFGRLLSLLRPLSLDGTPKYLYGSAGGLYPVQTYLHAKPGRIEGLAGGLYYYDPVGHGLLQVSAEAELDPGIHGWINQPVAERAAFTVFFVAKVGAIAPMYADQSRDYCLLEAGLMAQLLDGAAAGCEIGLCQLGGLDFEAIRDRFGLDASHQYVYGLLGGRLDHEREEAEIAAATLDVWEEGAL